MRTKMTAAAAVMGLVALVLVGGLFGGDASGAPNAPSGGNCDPIHTNEVGAAQAEGNCAILEVTKVVTGTVPPGTTFPVQVVCTELMLESQGFPPADGPPLDTTLTFPAEGGTRGLLLDLASECAITETPPAGCTLVSIDPPTVEVDGDDVKSEAVIPVTVTNNCEVAAAPAAIPAAPTFTG